MLTVCCKHIVCCIIKLPVSYVLFPLFIESVLDSLYLLLNTTPQRTGLLTSICQVLFLIMFQDFISLTSYTRFILS